MPIPTPTTSESEDEFIARCMGDEVMNEDYPDEEQRAGVCYTQWENRNKGNAMNKHLTIPLEIKALNKREFEGYGSVFGNKDYGDDVVMPGAFKRTLAEHKQEDTLPMMFWMHDPSRIPGKWLDMSEDDHGLYVKGQLAETPLGDEIHTLLGIKAVRGLSIGYSTRDQDYDNDGVRLIKDVDLWETSIVSLAMNPLAEVTHSKSRLTEQGLYVPNTDELANLKRDLEHFLRSKGFNKQLAKTYVSNTFKDHNGVMSPAPGAMPSEDELLKEAELEYVMRNNEGEMPDAINNLKQLSSSIRDDVQETEMRQYPYIIRSN